MLPPSFSWDKSLDLAWSLRQLLARLTVSGPPANIWVPGHPGDHLTGCLPRPNSLGRAPLTTERC